MLLKLGKRTFPLKPNQTIKGDQLFGRGTTDCLGHVALCTDLLCSLAELKPKLSVRWAIGRSFRFVADLLARSLFMYCSLDG